MDRLEELKDSLKAWMVYMIGMDFTQEEIMQALADAINGE